MKQQYCRQCKRKPAIYQELLCSNCKALQHSNDPQATEQDLVWYFLNRGIGGRLEDGYRMLEEDDP
jgi:hypothetical protein